jgi:hypothetical protein
MTSEQYIKKVLHKKQKTKTPIPKGNFGAKAKSKANSLSIK